MTDLSYVLTWRRKVLLVLVLATVLGLIPAPVARAQSGIVNSFQKISATEGGFTGSLENRDQFGSALQSVGDVDSDGIADLAVGAGLDDDGGSDRGAMWVLFMNE